MRQTVGTTGHTTTYAYDALGRQTAVQDARGAVHSRCYDGSGRVAWESDPATNGTWYAYDSLGRRIAVTNALGQVTHTAYDAEGRTVASWGATYPVAYEYDSFGRMTAMATTRDNDLNCNFLALLPAGVHLSQVSHPSYPAALDTTRWFYDEATGLLTNKVYADGKGTAYTYTSDGQLASRIWARGVTTAYAYDLSGSLTNIDYSDSTPDVAFIYDRLGRMVSAIVAGISTNAYTYDPETLALTAETQNGMEIDRTTDALGRDTGFSLPGSPYAVQYAYDAYGRFIAVTAQVQFLTHGYTYGYLAGSDLVATMANSHGHTATRTYDPVLPHITRVHNGFTGGRTISQYDYTYDALGRRTAIANSGEAFTFSNANDLAAFNLYGYNTRSEVTSAARYWGTDTGDTSDAVDGQQYAYAFDPIGNRITSAEGDTSRTATYTANALNQYSQRTVPDEKDLIGTAPTNVAVTVNQNPVSRQSAYWHHALEVDNSTEAAYPDVAITAVYNPPGTNDPDVVTSQTGRVFVAQTPEAFQYDSDGNLTQDGRFTYTWDSENRLIGVTTRDDLPASVSRVMVEYAYDHQSRRIASSTAVWTNGSWQAVDSRSFLYDGWNVVKETINHQQPTTNYYTWGLDLSGSLQGAGGIGGLLAASLDGTTALYCYDANGNVGQLVSTDGELLAHYEFSPFGETVVSTGPLAKSNPFRFSTKWFDNDTGLGYWGYRWYGPGMGRWINKDPLREKGGIAIYQFVRNAPTVRWDMLGCIIDDSLLFIKGPMDRETFNETYKKIKPNEDPSNSIGASWTYFLADWTCNKCDPPEERCYKLDLLEDTYLRGAVFWIRFARSTRTGRLVGTHEMTHVKFARRSALAADAVLHALTGGNCSSLNCCLKKSAVVRLTFKYYSKLADYDGAHLDYEDYPLDLLAKVEKRLEEERIMKDSLFNELQAAEVEMKDACQTK
jgi:RHS repeat-associated protein